MKRFCAWFGNVALCAALVGGVAGGSFWVQHKEICDTPIGIHDATQFEIKVGDSLNRVADRLVTIGVLNEPLHFQLEARHQAVDDKLQAGVYALSSQDTIRSLLSRFVAGDVKKYQITLVEGLTFRELRAVLDGTPKLKHDTTGITDNAIMERLDAAGEHPEGRFFPSTYYYGDQTSDFNILRRAYGKMLQELERLWATRAPDLPYEKPYDALIMASIIEKETGLASERAEIAGVFVRRLQRGMKLQTDPTVIYGIGRRFDGDLRRADLAADTPYNTYVYDGLPPTPIAMPGIDALHAALHPNAGESLFFVARGDGSHVFSATLEDHNRAVKTYQLGQQ